MSKTFNLLDEHWLPVCMSDGSLRDVGLLELFERAHEIRDLAETSPASLIATYRLLLAITHRSLMRHLGTWKDRDRVTWYRGGLPPKAVTEYLEYWREHFCLFHAEQPFMQVAALATAEKTIHNLKPWTQVSLARATGNAPLMFDHSYDAAPEVISPAVAIRSLLGCLQFVTGGLVKVLRTSDKAGPLANSAASIPIGNSLNETLCLALHPYSAAAGHDIPAWERPSPSLDALLARPALAKGPNDRYSRISRAILFRREKDGGVRWIHFAAGVALAEDAKAPDPMASYRAGHEKLVRLSFREGRALWRDLPALVPDAEGKAAQPAAVLGWASNLRVLLGESHADQALLIAGVTSDQAKLVRWRLERTILPTPLLIDSGLARILREEVNRAEEVYGKLRAIAVGVVAATMPDSGRKDTRERARTALDTGPTAAAFFSAAERTLPGVMALIANREIDDAHAIWSQALLQAASTSWDLLRYSMGQSPLALRAEAQGYPRFRSLVHTLRTETTFTAPSMEVPA